MSLFGGFTPRDKAVEYSSSSTAFEDVNLPSFLFKELVNKDEIGRGGFSSVFTAELPQTGEKVAVKKFLGNDQIDGKILIKEAKLLNSLQHPNIVAFKGICKDKYALLLEFVQFDLRPFGVDLQVRSLSELLCHFDKSNCEGISRRVFYRAAEDVASGIQYLHAKGIAHRDLKPANILVSNQHYCWMTDQNDIEKESLISPLVCKLTDFGESRSREVQTNTILTSKTNRIDRGTPVFMAPEVLLENLSAGKASVPFMQKADIWAFGMIVFCIINPGLKHPYELNMQIEANIKSAVACLEKMVECHTKPKPQEKYSVKQREEWKELWQIYESCTVFEQMERPNIEGIVESLNVLNSPSPAYAESSFSGESSERDIHLKVSQASFFEKCSEIVTNRIQEGLVLDQTEIDQLNSYIASGDATNSCTFLCLQIAENVLRANASSTITWEDVAEISESVILTLPEDINDIRQISLTYDVMEAYTILRNANLLSSIYTFTEELPYAFGVFSDEGKAKLTEKIKELPWFHFG